MKNNERKKNILLTVLFTVLAGAVLFTSRTGTRVKASDYDVKCAAYDRMEACMEAVKKYREETGIPLSPEDRFATGLIGLEWSGTSTTLGSLEAKRTTANPAMAALLVEMLTEAGLKEGCTVGIGASGSFPALNIAAVSACNELGIRVVILPSVGSSAWGANHPALPFPVMLERLRRDALLTCDVPFVTWGGDYDTGAEMTPDDKTQAEEALSAFGLIPVQETDYARNIAMRQEAYGAIDCFIGIGGHWTTLGSNAEETLPAGVIMPSETLRPVRENSGLIARYHADGLPVFNLLNIREIAADYDLAFDPASLPARGESSVFFRTRYPKLPALFALLFTGIVLFLFRKQKRDVSSATQ